MTDTDPSWLSAVLSKHSRDNAIVNVISVSTEPAVGVGDNYASIIVRATLKVVLGSGNITTKKVILKKGLPDIPPEIVAEMSGAFSVEGILYNYVLSKYENLINEHGVPYDKFWPDCIHASHNLIMFEDLKMSGFTLGTRKTGLDPIHGKLVFTNLARLHSLSLIAVSNGSVYPKMLPPYILTESTIGETFFKTSLNALADVIRDSWSLEYSKIEKKIRSMIEDIIPTLVKLYKEPHKLSVVNHGDCWVNNMMFKYNTEGSPVELKFVDFQISHYNTYAWDLSYFLHTSIHPRFLSANYDSFIETYCSEFSKNLERFDFDVSRAPTVQEVKDELTRLQPFALASACSVLPITANPSDIKIGLGELLNDVGKFKLLFEDKIFEKTIQDMFKYFSDLGMF